MKPPTKPAATKIVMYWLLATAGRSADDGVTKSGIAATDTPPAST